VLSVDISSRYLDLPVDFGAEIDFFSAETAGPFSSKTHAVTYEL
jgi:hypothetical protein